jgi:hypothetical protein
MIIGRFKLSELPAKVIRKLLLFMGLIWKSFYVWAIFHRKRKWKIAPLKFARKIIGVNDVDNLRKYFINRRSPRYLFDESQIVEILEYYKISDTGESDLIILQAEAVLNGDFSYFVPLAKTMSTPCPNWFHDLTTQNDWPVTWFRNIDYSSEERVGEIRHLWDLHRHFFLVRLAQAWRITNDHRYLDRLILLFRDWWEKNPVGFGIAWIGPQIQEVAIRNMQWTNMFFLLLEDEKVDSLFIAELLNGIYLQAKFIACFFNENKELSHNHLISESGGLWQVAYIFPEFPESRKWLLRSECTFVNALDLQHFDDGVQGEFSTNYQCFVLETFLQNFCICKHNDISTMEFLEPKLKNSIEYISWLTKPDGNIPYIGDADDGLSYIFAADPYSNRFRYASTGAILFNSPKLKTLANRFCPESAWLLGSCAFKKWDSLPKKDDLTNSRYFESSNTFVNRDHARGDFWLCFWGGGRMYIPGVGKSHNHDDTLSVLLHVNGVDVLSDPGTYLYNASEEKRTHFRKRSSHSTSSLCTNLINVEAGRFLIKDLAENISTVFLNKEVGIICASSKSMNQIYSRDLVVLKNGVIWITDKLEGPGENVESTFIVAKDAMKKSRYELHSFDSNGKEIKFMITKELGWKTALSTRYGTWTPAEFWVSKPEKVKEYGNQCRHLLIPDRIDWGFGDIIKRNAVINQRNSGLCLDIDDFVILEDQSKWINPEFSIFNNSGGIIVYDIINKKVLKPGPCTGETKIWGGEKNWEITK